MRFITAGLMALGLAAAGCGSVDNIADCSKICDRYKSCYDASYDTATCYDRCRADSKSDPHWQAKVNTCDTCEGGRSCTGTVFNCAADCSGIVP